jgi:hypothetical protein
MIRNWGMLTLADFDRHFTGSPHHPDYGVLLEVLRHSHFAWDGIDRSNLRRLYERANAETAPEAVVLIRPTARPCWSGDLHRQWPGARRRRGRENRS